MWPLHAIAGLHFTLQEFGWGWWVGLFLWTPFPDLFIIRGWLNRKFSPMLIFSLNWSIIECQHISFRCTTVIWCLDTLQSERHKYGYLFTPYKSYYSVIDYTLCSLHLHVSTGFSDSRSGWSRSSLSLCLRTPVFLRQLDIKINAKYNLNIFQFNIVLKGCCFFKFYTKEYARSTVFKLLKLVYLYNHIGCVLIKLFLWKTRLVTFYFWIDSST